MKRIFILLKWLIIYSINCSLSNATILSISLEHFSGRFSPFIVSITESENIQSLRALIATYPINVSNVISIDSNFEMQYEIVGRDLLVNVNRIANNITEIADLFEIHVDRFNVPPKFDDVRFGEISIKYLDIIDKSGNTIFPTKIIPGGWYTSYDFIPSFLVFLNIGNQKLPVHNAIVVYELIGRAGLVSYGITDNVGSVYFSINSFGRFPNIDIEQYLPDLNFSSLEYDTFRARFTVIAKNDTSVQFKTFSVVKDIKPSTGLAYEDIIINIPEETLVDEWQVYE